MAVKNWVFGTVAVATGLYFGGVFDAKPRVVAGSPATVMASLADLDVREMPGEPGSTAEAAGGIKPRFQLDRSPNRLEWTVYSGTEVATRMIATFEPVDGDRTQIVATVERGDAPDSRISPAFRSTGMTLGLFNMALDTEIAEMTAPGWGDHCDALRDKLLSTDGMTVAGGSLGTIAKLHSAQAELLAAGCNIDKAPGAGEGFRRTTSTMGAPDGYGGR
jgi:hypothetical protein